MKNVRHRFLLVLASLAVSSSAPAVDEPPEKPAAKEETPAAGEKASKDSAADAARALRTGDYDAAIEGFKSLTLASKEAAKPASASSGRAAARRGWADALAATGKYDEALEVLRGDAASASDPLLLNLAGAVLARTGRLEEALKTLEKASAVEDAPLPARVEAQVRRGEVARLKGLLDEARAAFEKSIDMYKEMDEDEAEKLPAETFVEWGRALIGLNRYEEANKIMFAQAGEKDPKCPSLLLVRARSFQDKYDFPYSRKLLGQALSENARFADAQAALADNLLTDFTAGPDRFEGAGKAADKALEVNPRCAAAYLARGGLWLYDGNYPKAIADLERAVKEDPASLEARGLLGACVLLSSDGARFAREEAAAKELNPKGAEFYHTVAQALDHRFRYVDAVAMCDKALALDADYWPAFVTLGINCLRTGENARGRKFLERSWEKDPYNPWVFNTRKLLKHMDQNYVPVEDGDFVFYFPKPDAEVLKTYLVPLIKDAKAKFEARYKTKLAGPIQVEDFSEHQWFSARTVGLPDFAATGACFGKLVTLTTPKALPQNWGAVAWHEFAHVAALSLTAHRVPRWLTEGLSVYEEGLDHPHWARDFQRDLADAWASGRLLPLAELDFGFSKPKYPQQILISYFQGCMIVKLLVERGGFDKVLEILRGYREEKSTARIFQDALGQKLEDFDKDFDAYMAKWVEANGYRPRLSQDVIPVLEARLEKSPDDAKLLAELAWAYFSTGNDVDASLTATKALEKDPACGDAEAVVGLARLKEKRNQKASESFAKALKDGTRFAALCHAQLGSLKAKDRASKKEAIGHLEEAKKLSPIAVAGHPAQGNVYYQLAKLYEEDGDGERAIQQMIDLAKFAVEDIECRQRIARHALEVKKDPKLAIRYLDELMYLNPFDAKFHRLLARAAADAGEHDIAIRENLVLLSFPDTNPRQARLALAKAYLAKGDKKNAAAEAKRLLALDPSHAEAAEILRQAEEKQAGEK